MSGKRVKFKGKDGKDYGVFLNQITYYRSYVESSDKMGDVPTLKTSVYLVGSTKALIFPISWNEFDKIVDELLKS